MGDANGIKWSDRREPSNAPLHMKQETACIEYSPLYNCSKLTCTFSSDSWVRLPPTSTTATELSVCPSKGMPLHCCSSAPM